MKWAGSPANIGVPVLPALMAINAEVARKHGKPPLDAGEVSGIAKSVERYRAGWIARGQFSKVGDLERSAWGRSMGLKGGLASGKARRKRTEARDREIVADRIEGMSLRAIGRKHGVDEKMVRYVLKRDAPLWGAE